jgi:hypothetical protein
LRVVLAALAYFLLVFAARFLLGPVRVLVLEPSIGPAGAVLAEVPFLILAMLAAARLITGWRAIPPGRPRLAMGAWAFALLAVTEIAGAAVLRDMPPAVYFAQFRTVAGLVSLGLFILFALMPWLLARRP